VLEGVGAADVEDEGVKGAAVFSLRSDDSLDSRGASAADADLDTALVAVVGVPEVGGAGVDDGEEAAADSALSLRFDADAAFDFRGEGAGAADADADPDAVVVVGVESEGVGTANIEDGGSICSTLTLRLDARTCFVLRDAGAAGADPDADAVSGAAEPTTRFRFAGRGGALALAPASAAAAGSDLPVRTCRGILRFRVPAAGPEDAEAAAAAG
jgi:hypothetical protein